MINVKKKISLVLAAALSFTLIASGCKKTDENAVDLNATSVSVSELTQMTTTTTAAPETEPVTEETTTVTEETTTVTEETTAATEITTTAAEETTTAASEETTTASSEAETTRTWNETEIDEEMYTSQACYSRIKPIVGSDPVDRYTKGTKVNIVAATDTGYYKLDDGSFIHSDYLVEDDDCYNDDLDDDYDDDYNEEIFPDDDDNDADDYDDDDDDDNTGSSGTSDPVTSVTHAVKYTDRYAYNTLNDKEKEFYKNLYDAVSTYKSSVEIPQGLLSDGIIKVYAMVYNQEAQFFWMDANINPSYGSMKLNYEYTQDEIKSIQKTIDANVSRIMSAANKCNTTAGKLKVFYDWVIKNNSFALTGTAATCSIASGLSGNGELQCVGYAKTMLYLCDIAGIDCMTIVGNNRTGSTHAWNVVYCDNGYYILDAAWGDPIGAPGGSNYVKYSFFLVPDAWTKETHLNVNKHTRSNGDVIKFFTPPSCTKTTYNYYRIYGKEYDNLDDAAQGMYDALKEAINAGKNVAEIRVTSQDMWDTLLSNSYAVKFQKYAQEIGDVEKLSRQKNDNVNNGVVQYNIIYN